MSTVHRQSHLPYQPLKVSDSETISDENKQATRQYYHSGMVLSKKMNFLLLQIELSST